VAVCMGQRAGVDSSSALGVRDPPREVGAGQVPRGSWGIPAASSSCGVPVLARRHRGRPSKNSRSGPQGEISLRLKRCLQTPVGPVSGDRRPQRAGLQVALAAAEAHPLEDAKPVSGAATRLRRLTPYAFPRPQGAPRGGGVAVTPGGGRRSHSSLWSKVFGPRSQAKSVMYEVTVSAEAGNGLSLRAPLCDGSKSSMASGEIGRQRCSEPWRPQRTHDGAVIDASAKLAVDTSSTRVLRGVCRRNLLLARQSHFVPLGRAGVISTSFFCIRGWPENGASCQSSPSTSNNPRQTLLDQVSSLLSRR